MCCVFFFVFVLFLLLPLFFVPCSVALLVFALGVWGCCGLARSLLLPPPAPPPLVGPLVPSGPVSALLVPPSGYLVVSATARLTELLGNVELVDWPGECDHPSRVWVIPWNGARSWGPHPPLKGRQLAIPAELWSPSLLRRTEPSGPYLTKETAHYPGALNEALAKVFVASLGQPKRKAAAAEAVLPCRDFSDRPTPMFKVPRNTEQSPFDECIGGLRRPFRCLEKVPGLLNLGVQIRNVIDQFCRGNPDFKFCYLRALAHDEDVHFPGDPVLVDALRTEVSKVLLRNHPKPNSVDVTTMNDSPPDTCLKANFIELWVKAAGDPAARLARWLQEGAPGGLRLHPDLTGLFPLSTRVTHNFRLMNCPRILIRLVIIWGLKII